MENNIIYSSQFKSWFGDWQNGGECSKVVDGNGFPLVVYHGSPADFNEFKSEFMGQTGTGGGQGFYFSSDEDQARGFGNTKSFYLNIRKPLSFTNITISLNDFIRLLDNVDKAQVEKDPDFGYGVLSDYGDVDSYGRYNVLRQAAEMEMESSTSDVELVGGIINASGDYDLVVDVLRNTLGYDGVILEDRGVYIVHHANQIKRVGNTNFNTQSNNFNESRKIIYITESQFKHILK